MKNNKIISFFKLHKSVSPHSTINDCPDTVSSKEEQQITEKKALDPLYVMNFDGCSKGNPGEAGAG